MSELIVLGAAFLGGATTAILWILATRHSAYREFQRRRGLHAEAESRLRRKHAGEGWDE